MERRTIHFSGPIWERLQALSKAEDAPLADVLRNLLTKALGLDEEALAAVQVGPDAGDPVPKLRRDVIRQQIDHGKLANEVSRLRLDLDTLADADLPRQTTWEEMKASFDALHSDTQAHIDRAEALFRQTAQTLAAQHQGMQDLRAECGALRHGIEQLATVCVDLLRRAKATEQGGVPPAEAVEAIERGERWLNALEADILAKTGGRP